MSREAIIIKSPDEVRTMRDAGRIVAEVLEVLKEKVRPGATTLDLDKIAEEETRKRRAVPAFKGYKGYPHTLCTSVNEQVVHGMPSKRVLFEGDILSIDFGVLFKGFYGDSAVTLPVGKVSDEASRLMMVTEEALGKAIDAARPGNRLGDVSAAVQTHVEAHGFSVVREFVGHGIGRELHEPPQVPNFGIPGRGIKLKAGMVFAIEPMINIGGWAVKVLNDGWTAVTADGSLSAHFEHMVAVTESGPQVLSSL